MQTITDTLDPAANESYGYDELGRLVSAQGRYGRLAYAYDATGNRAADWRDGAETRYTYDPASQKLLSLSGARVDTFAYDANGNTVLAGGRELVYAPDQRLSAVRLDGADIARHRYGADGWRAGKAAAGADAAYTYGPDGRLLEDGGAGAYHAWLDGEPLARLPYYRPGSRHGAVLDVLYYHNTPSGTPHTATDKAGRVAWKANAEPFGRMSPSGPAVQNLRFPGQWFDAEDGLHYNMARYYDSALGRYLQADPIGLRGGVNLYGYVGGDPVNAIDPLGLDELRLYAWGQGFRLSGQYLEGGTIIGGPLDPREVAEYGINIGTALGASELVAARYLAGVGKYCPKGVNSAAASGTSTVYRVQGGVMPNASKTLITLDANGNPIIQSGTLNISIGDASHAEYFKTKGVPGGRV